MADMYKNVNGVNVKLTEEEVKEEKEKDAAWAAGANERKKEVLRSQRTKLLLEADHKIFAIEDVSGDTSAWKTYRQNLRDITKVADLDNVTWPTKPSK